MYGTLDAAERWGEHYVETLCVSGFVRGTASPCHFYQRKLDIWMLVHGDEFVVVAREAGRKHTEETLRKAYEIKVDVVGPIPTDPKESKILGRIITYSEEGLLYEADPGHMEKVNHEFGLGTVKGW